MRVPIGKLSADALEITAQEVRAVVPVFVYVEENKELAQPCLGARGSPKFNPLHDSRTAVMDGRDDEALLGFEVIVKGHFGDTAGG